MSNPTALEFVSALLEYTDCRSTKALDVGCGEGTMGLELCREVRSITMIDPSAETLGNLGIRIRERNIENASVQCGDIFAVNSTDKFDIITFFLSLHHIAAIDSLLCKMHDLSHPGTIIAIAEVSPRETVFHRHDAVPHDTLSSYYVIEKLRDNGFDILRKASLPPICKTDNNGVPERFETYMILATLCP